MTGGDGISVDGYTSDGEGLIVTEATQGGTRLEVLDPETGKVVDPLQGIALATPTPDPAHLLVVPDGAQQTALYDIHAHSLVAGSQIALSFAPDGITSSGRWGLVWTSQGSLREIDLQSDRIIGPTIDGDEPIFGAAATDARHLVTVGPTGIARRDPATGAKAGPSVDNVYAVVAVPGHLVGAGEDGRVSVLDSDTLHPIGGQLPSIIGGPDSITTSDDSSRLVVRGRDGAVHILDVATTSPVGDAIDVGQSASGVALRPDGRELAMSTAEGLVVWNLDPSVWSSAACRLAGRDITQAEWDEYLASFASPRSVCSGHVP